MKKTLLALTIIGLGHLTIISHASEGSSITATKQVRGTAIEITGETAKLLSEVLAQKVTPYQLKSGGFRLRGADLTCFPSREEPAEKARCEFWVSTVVEPSDGGAISSMRTIWTIADAPKVSGELLSCLHKKDDGEIFAYIKVTGEAASILDQVQRELRKYYSPEWESYECQTLADEKTSCAFVVNAELREWFNNKLYGRIVKPHQAGVNFDGNKIVRASTLPENYQESSLAHIKKCDE